MSTLLFILDSKNLERGGKGGSCTSFFSAGGDRRGKLHTIGNSENQRGGGRTKVTPPTAFGGKVQKKKGRGGGGKIEHQESETPHYDIYQGGKGSKKSNSSRSISSGEGMSKKEKVANMKGRGRTNTTKVNFGFRFYGGGRKSGNCAFHLFFRAL